MTTTTKHKRENTPPPRSLADLSHAVSAILAEAPDGDRLRFRVMDLAEEILAAADGVRDDLTRSTLRGWIGRIQRHAGLQG